MARNKLDLNLSIEEKLDVTSIIIKAQASDKRLVERCRIILLTHEGKSLDAIAETLGVSRATANFWRQKFLKKRIEGLTDKKRSGRPRNFKSKERLQVLAKYYHRQGNAMRLSNSDLAAELIKENLAISKSTINRILLGTGLKSQRIDQLQANRYEEFDEKCAQVVGLYMNDREKALVISVGENSEMHLPGGETLSKMLRPPRPLQTIENVRVRHGGAQALISSFIVQSGETRIQANDNDEQYKLTDFIQNMVTIYPDKYVNFIMDKLGPRRVKELMESFEHQGAKIHFHFAPNHTSWLNHVDLWFHILARKSSKQNIFDSVDDMVAILIKYIEHFNKNAKPFYWIYDESQ
jgi:transposase